MFKMQGICVVQAGPHQILNLNSKFKLNSKYKVFVNIVKYKLDHMRKKMETEERDATSRSSFRLKTLFLLRNRI